MSIKSQKSLNDECSEIFERSYSVKSVSNDSLSSSEEEETLARELMRRLTPAMLVKLRYYFRAGKLKDSNVDRKVEDVMRKAAAEEGIEFPKRASREDRRGLDREEFRRAVGEVLGTKYTTHSDHLHSLLEPFSTRVTWSQLVSRLGLEGARNTRSQVEGWKLVTVQAVVRLKHCKRETIVKLVSIEKEASFCYAAVSKGGRVGVYCGRMELLYQYEVFYHKTGLQKRVKNSWVTDAIYLSDVECLLLSASDRSLMFYDAATVCHKPVYCISGLPNIPTCLSYWPSPSGSDLVLGTERGALVRMVFLQPRVSLFYTKTSDRVNNYLWMELSSPPHTSYVSLPRVPRAHPRCVRRVQHTRRHRLVSCARDSETSLVVRHLPGKMDSVVYKVARGVTAFHMSPCGSLVSCGGEEVHLWGRSPKPLAVLTPSPRAKVLDVALVVERRLVIAFCEDCSLHIWDQYEECLLQSLKIPFPVRSCPEFGAYCLHPGPPRRPPIVSTPASPVLSRRGSSVFQAPTGGMILQEDEDRSGGEYDGDANTSSFNRQELLITCCDYVCTIVLDPKKDHGDILPPPGDTLRARRPSFWDLPDDVLAPTESPVSPPAIQTHLQHQHQLLSPASAELGPHDIESLLEKADLKGLLEKDFVMMYNLKHDLNKKLADLKANMTAISTAVSMGAPYLALHTTAGDPPRPGDPYSDRYQRTMRLFPCLEITATPTSSVISTPKKRTSLLKTTSVESSRNSKINHS